MSEDAMSDDSDIECSKEHSKMLSAISKLDFTERIKPASRKEPSLQVSEFHLAKLKKSKGKSGVDVTELANALKSPQTIALRRKLHEFKDKSATLDKPVEKIVEDKVKRKEGFKKVKSVLSRWDSVVESNRTADQLEFPAKKTGVKVYETNIFSSVTNPQTEVEKKVFAMLQESGYMNKKLEEPEVDEYPMTLEEVLAQRQEFGDLKRKSILQQKKAWRQNKIKSKKFHRILRREKMRQQIKEFEELKEKNPEEALKRLDQIEKSRAHERASLRHKNTGTWAKSLQIRAKYNKESRQVLAQQIELSRELTQKIKKAEDISTDEAESEDESAAPHPDLAFADKDGTAQNVSENEISKFLSGYRKFWEEKNKNKTASKEKKADVENGEVETPSEIVDSPDEEEDQLELIEELKEVRKNQEQAKTSKKAAAKPSTLTARKGPKKRKSASGSWMVEEDAGNVMDLFDKLEEKQHETIDRSLDRLRAEVSKSKKSGKALSKKKDKKGKKGKASKGLKKNGFEGGKEITLDMGNTESTSKEAEPAKKKSKPNLPVRDTSKNIDNIDPTKFLNPKPLRSSQGEMIVIGGEDLDEDPDSQQKAMLSELFADDDVVEEFRKEKEDLEESSKPKEIDMTLPGWGEWGGSDMKVSTRKRKRFILKPKVEAPRKDRHLRNVIINERKDTGIAEHQVSDLPYPFTNVADYEASIRAPIGRTWVSEVAHRQLTAPRIVTHAGQKIEPMTEDALVQTENLLIKKKKNIKKGK